MFIQQKIFLKKHFLPKRIRNLLKVLSKLFPLYVGYLKKLLRITNSKSKSKFQKVINENNLCIKS